MHMAFWMETINNTIIYIQEKEEQSHKRVPYDCN